jgi:POT family proton-dependent oligopeptide transporter
MIFILCQNQMSTNTVSQSGEMETHGVPNDLLPNVNSIAVILLMPVLTHLLYPSLRRWNIAFPPITRMAVGFGFEALGMGYAAGIQGWIYSSGPCYDHPLKCPASNNGMIPNDVNVATQIPVYVLQGLSESFAFPACYEYAYTKAPKSMKSIVQSILSLSFAGAAIIGLALSPTYHDPHLLVMYASLAGAMFLTTIIFALVFWKYNRMEKEMNAKLRV